MSTSQQGTVTIVGAIFRHKVLLASIFLLTLLFTLVNTLTQKKQYASHMKVLVQNARETAVVSSQANAGENLGSGADSMEARVNSEIDLLGNEDLLEHLVAYRSKLRGEPVPEIGSRQMAGATGGMAGRLTAEPVKKSNVIALTYIDLTPELAQKILQELERFYLEKHVQLSRPAGTSQFFTGEASSYHQQLAGAEKRLADFRTENQFVALDKEKVALDDNLHALEVSSLADEAQLRSVTGQLNELNSRLRALQDRITTVIVSSPNQQGVQTLFASLTDLRNRRITLLARFKPNDRLITEIDDQIHNMEDALADLRAKDAVTTSTDNNPASLALKQQLETLQIQRAGLAEGLRIHHLQQQDYQERLDHLQQITPENDTLERQVTEIRGLDQSVSDKRDAAKMEDLLDAGQFGNVAVAQAPTLSRQHVKPRLSVNLILGAVTGFFLCAAALLLLESTRSTVLTPADMEGISDAPVLATVPEFAGLASLLEPARAGPAATPLRPARASAG